MQSPHTIHRISPSDRECIHFYYDVCPESPDGKRVAFFAFDRTPTGDGRQAHAEGRAVIADRDGGNFRVIGGPVPGNSHDGARVQWIDNEHVAHLSGEPGTHKTVVVRVADGSRRELPGALRMVSPAGPIGLTTRHDFEPGATGLRDAVCAMDLLTGGMRQLFTVADALAQHPRGTDIAGIEHVHFLHTKWSPDGSRFFVGCANLSGYSADGQKGEPFGAMFVGEADGSDIRFVSAEGHHLCWGADSQTIVGFTPNATGGEDLTAFDIGGAPPRKVILKVRGKHASVNARMTQVLADVTNAYGFPKKGHGGIYLYDVRNEQPEVLATMKMPNVKHSGVHCHPVFSREEKRVYFNAGEDGRRALFALDITERPQLDAG